MPDASDFTPNPDRAIWVSGRIEEALLERLRPEILELTAQNLEPITVFINSRGGIPEVAEDILSLLRRTTESDRLASRIITVAAPEAHSAAAYLLSAGDFAIAHSESSLLYHGRRYLLPEGKLTGEWAKTGRLLSTFHEMSAAALARSSIRRFLFIVSSERALFAQHRADHGDASLTDLDCFQAILRGHLSPVAQKVLDRAIPLWSDYNGLFLQFVKRLRKGRTASKTYIRKLMLHASMAFEYESNKGDVGWDGGLGRISDHFCFLNAYFDIENFCKWLAAPAGPQIAGAGLEADHILQFRLFFLALCRALQEGENKITPADALWLGLIDTVRKNLPRTSAP